MKDHTSRRSFLKYSAGMIGMAGLSPLGFGQAAAIPGFDDTGSGTQSKRAWEPVSDRKVRMGIVGHGLCQMGAAFGLQNHPNVEVVAVSDLVPERCKALAQICRCSTTYPSLKELLRDGRVEAVFLGTDAPSHGRQCIEVLKAGKHVGTACPAVYGGSEALEEADELYETVKRTGLKYMMFETSVFHDANYAMRQIYRAGGFGKLVYSEGEYFHYMPTPIDSWKGWRIGLPPQWYPTHSNAYYTGVSGGSFTEVSCMGIPSTIPHLRPENNRYGNPFGTEIALFRTSEGGMARMAVSWDSPGYEGEMGRVRGQKGSMHGTKYAGLVDVSKFDLSKPPLPPGVGAGGHGGSHGYLGNEFITAILQDRLPLVDVAWALNMSVSGMVAHMSALKDGELMKIPQYSMG
jgi:predicted dehydrogenase